MPAKPIIILFALTSLVLPVSAVSAQEGTSQGEARDSRTVEVPDECAVAILDKTNARNVAAIINERLPEDPGKPLVKADEGMNRVVIIGSAERISGIMATIGLLEALAAEAEQGGEKIGTQPRTYHFEFRNAPWNLVLDWLVDITQLPLIGLGRPTGTVNFKPATGRGGRPKQYTATEIIDELNEILLSSSSTKWIIVRRTASMGFYPADEPLPIDIVRAVTVRELHSLDLGKTEFVKVHYQMTRGSAERLAPAIKQFMGPFSQIVPLEETHQLILIDQAGKLRQSLPIIQEIESRHGG